LVFLLHLKEQGAGDLAVDNSDLDHILLR